MRKRIITLVLTGLVVLTTACANGGSTKEKTTEAKTAGDKTTISTTETTQEETDTETTRTQIIDIVERVENKISKEQVVPYSNKIEDESKDQVVLLAKSENGKFVAYGIISPEYGKRGILINNIIDNKDNINHFDETWTYGSEQPSLVQTNDYAVTFKFSQKKDGKDAIKEIKFETYDTGTMSPIE